jgi:MFS family permease
MDDPHYIMKKSEYLNGDFDKVSYGTYMSFYTLGMIPSLLLLGPISNTMNRKNILGFCMIISSVAVALHALVKAMWNLYVLIFLVGFFQGMVSAIPY